MEETKIWTTLGKLKQADLVRNQKQYTIDIGECSELILDNWIQVDAQITSTGSTAYVDSPEGFGPYHKIKLDSLDFLRTKKRLIKYLLMRSATAFWRLHHFASLITGHISKEAWECYADPYEEIGKTLNVLEDYISLYKIYLKMLYKMTYKDELPEYKEDDAEQN